MGRFLLRHNQGQALPLVGLMAIVLFLMIGLAIDGGLLYAQRRVMQNTADAACLAAANSLALNRINTGLTLAQTAESAAQQVILNNLGATPGSGVNAPGTLAYTNISEIYSVQAGTGTDLTKGIEISGPDVRVALQSPANTFFMRAIGYNTYTVPARAHCDAKAGGGGVPFAVSRWRGYDDAGNVKTDGLSTNTTLPQTYKQGSEDKVMTVRDLLAQESKSIICQPPATTVPSSNCENWPGWYDPDYPGDPAAATGLYSGAIYPAEDKDGFRGPETWITGTDAKPNVGDPNFTGPIVLDFRQTTFTPQLFYNGLLPTTALPKYKDFATRYILGTYPGPYVIPGQQIAYYPGVSAGLITKPFDQRYNVNDSIAVLIYNGTINQDPDFAISFPGASNVQRTAGSGPTSCVETLSSDEKFDGKAGNPTERQDYNTFQIKLVPDAYSNFKLRAFISSASPGDWEGHWESDSDQSLPVDGPVTSISTSGKTLTFKVRPTNTFSCTDTVSGAVQDYPTFKKTAETIYLEIEDIATGKRRAVYVRLDQSADTSDFYAFFPQIPISYQPLEPGMSPSTNLQIDTVSGSSLDIGSGSSKVQVGTIEWYNPSDLSQPPATGNTHNGVTLDVSKQGASNKLSINVSNTATTGQEYLIRIPFTYQPSKTYTHAVWYRISVRAVSSNAASIDKYVYALGYANFKITEIGSNYIKGRAVSDLKSSPAELISGFQPRLLPWQ